MREAPHAVRDSDESIITTIETEEKRLLQLLDDARGEAERIAADAEARARARVAAVRDELPARIEARRAAEVERLEREVADTRRAAEEELEHFRRELSARIGAGVEAAVRIVWPETRDG